MITTPETDNHQQAEPKPQHDQQTASNPDNAQPGQSATPAQQDTPPAKAQRIKGKPGRPKNPLKDTWTPDQPLLNSRYEDMLKLKLAGKTQQEAYKITGKGHIRQKTAEQQASVIFNRPDVQARFVYLCANPAPQNAPGGTIPTAGRPAPAGKMPRKADLALAQRKASEALYLAETPADIVKAVSACRDLGLIDTAEQAKADPSLVLQAILSYAGRTGAEICAQLGGLAFMLDKFLTVCKVTWPELRETGDKRYPPAGPQQEPVE